MGNQLFTYAAARRLALVNDAELVLDDVSGFARDYKHRRSYQLDHFNIPCRKATAAERLQPFPRLRRRILLALGRLRPFEQRKYIRQETVDFDTRLLQVRPRGVVYLEGYWQGEGYFKDAEKTIRADLQIRPPSDPVNLAVAAHIQGTVAVAVHVRFFDAPAESAAGNNASTDYYHRAVALMEQHVPDAHYFVFSDNPEAARAVIPLADERVTCVMNNAGDDHAYADLWLMTLCQHFIIANSTFSWWGAWLCANERKRVFAPGFEKRHGMSSWGFKGLLPDGWARC
jgi:hypothetical protein